MGVSYKIGYKNIVLCGIDLYGEHFTQNPNKLSISDYQLENLHETARSIDGSISVVSIIDQFNTNIMRASGVQLFTATKYSLLTKYLPVYFQNL